MTVGTAQIVDNFRAASRPFAMEVAVFAFLLDKARDIGAFTAPAGHRQRAVFRRFWRAGTQRFTHVSYRIRVAAWFVVITGEGIARPQDHQTRVFRQRIFTGRLF